MHILMFGWEFPPRMSGGLGTACFGMTQALAKLGHRITLVLPRPQEAPPFLELLAASDFPPAAAPTGEGAAWPSGVFLHPVTSLLSPYLTAGTYRDRYLARGRLFPRELEVYGTDLLAEVRRYAEAGGAIARKLACDCIHAHDWMTVPAALEARRVSGMPLVLHVHSLEYDRSGEQVNPEVRRIEQLGAEQADRIIAVSHRTRRMLCERYGIAPEKVTVVYNAVTRDEARHLYRPERRERDRQQKMVLYLGRVTFQKGPDYFVEAAARVLQALPEVTFVMAGTGDMLARMIDRVGELGIGQRFHFTGFLQGEEIERIFSLADLYVMPSVSEPFGISPLEAMLYDVPVLISRQSGCAEILKHALKVDFWDVREIANKVIAVLKYPALAGQMAVKAKEELRLIRWETAADRIGTVYQDAREGR